MRRRLNWIRTRGERGPELLAVLWHHDRCGQMLHICKGVNGPGRLPSSMPTFAALLSACHCITEACFGSTDPATAKKNRDPAFSTAFSPPEPPQNTSTSCCNPGRPSGAPQSARLVDPAAVAHGGSAAQGQLLQQQQQRQHRWMQQRLSNSCWRHSSRYFQMQSSWTAAGKSSCMTDGSGPATMLVRRQQQTDAQAPVEQHLPSNNHWLTHLLQATASRAC